MRASSSARRELGAMQVLTRREHDGGDRRGLCERKRRDIFWKNAACRQKMLRLGGAEYALTKHARMAALPFDTSASSDASLPMLCGGRQSSSLTSRMVASAGASTAQMRVPSPRQHRIIILTREATAGRGLQSRRREGCIVRPSAAQQASICLRR